MRTPVLLPFSPVIIGGSAAGTISPDLSVNASGLGSDDFVPDPPPVRHEDDYAEIQISPDGGFSRTPSSRHSLIASSPMNAAPSDNGLVRHDVETWRTAAGRSRVDAAFVKVLIEQIRVGLWRGLAAGMGPLTQALIRGDKITVRIAQTGPTLRDYDIALFPGRIAYSHTRQMMWELDSVTGSLEPLVHPECAGTAFGSFYHRIQLQTMALSAGSLIQSLSDEQRASLTPPSEQRNANAPRPSAVVLYYNHVYHALIQQMDAYCRFRGLAPQGRNYLLHLAGAILRGLYRTETANPEFGRMPLVQVWIRNAWIQPSEANVQVNHGGAFIGEPIGPRDINLALIRHDPRVADTHPVIELQKVHFDSDIETQFLKELGIFPHKLLARLDALHPDFRAPV